MLEDLYDTEIGYVLGEEIEETLSKRKYLKIKDKKGIFVKVSTVDGVIELNG